MFYTTGANVDRLNRSRVARLKYEKQQPFKKERERESDRERES
jgi:hypothetical protein